ncbi:hypothetical protein LFYK43_08240 [Ligilactobacillus salitolerans]|uniref:Uncharacterized protein n=1 Tax=Ligilactobacillus salitolerans TaxID=1808352 RepID=A0A401IS88_9LACO|nr:hypothetical protein LFYK43_08240 [Ligilactobacillus salitolerans]
MNETQLSSEVKKLLKQVKEVAQKPVQLSFKEEKKGWLASDQAQFYLHDGTCSWMFMISPRPITPFPMSCCIC